MGLAWLLATHYTVHISWEAAKLTGWAAVFRLSVTSHGWAYETMSCCLCWRRGTENKQCRSFTQESRVHFIEQQPKAFKATDVDNITCAWSGWNGDTMDMRSSKAGRECPRIGQNVQVPWLRKGTSNVLENFTTYCRIAVIFLLYVFDSFFSSWLSLSV